MSNRKSNHQRSSHNFFPFSDDFLLFFLPMLDDETQRHLADFEENEPVFEDLDFDASAEADDFEEDYLIDDDDD